MLEKVAERHSDWVAMTKSFGCPHHLAEDVVQESYIRLHKYASDEVGKLYLANGEVNSFYMYVTLRNVYRNQCKAEGVYVNYEEFWEAETEEVDMEYEIAFNNLMSGIRQEVDNWGSYNSKLFNMYFKLGMSMRDIAKAGEDITKNGISLTHIFVSVNRYKARILERFDEEYNQLLKDFNK